MRATNTILIALLFILSATAISAMPDSFYKAMSNMRTENTICVKNYDAGASFTESYRDFEHLERETEVESRSYNTSSNQSDLTSGNASLEVHMNSIVQGKAHIAWQSREIQPDQMGRHATYSRASEDLTGVFNIEKFIQLWSNSTLGAVSTDWLPCS